MARPPPLPSPECGGNQITQEGPARQDVILRTRAVPASVVPRACTSVVRLTVSARPDGDPQHLVPPLVGDPHPWRYKASEEGSSPMSTTAVAPPRGTMPR